MSEHDEVGQAVAGAVTTAVTTAAYAARAITEKARATTLERARQAQADAREANSRLEAERRAARAALTVVDQPSWWDQAAVEDVLDLADLAEAWAPQDEHAARYARTIDDRARQRWSAGVADLRQSSSRHRAAGERDHAQLEVGEAVTLGATADALEARARDAVDENAAAEDRDEAAALHSEADGLWDSAERRNELAASLERVAQTHPKAVEARIISDRDQGAPPIGAVVTAGVKSRGRATTGTRGTRQRAAERGM